VSRLLAVVVALGVGLGLLVPAAGSGRSLPAEAEWRADVREAMKGGRAYLSRRADDRDGRRLAVNLDIDNTALATHYDTGEATPPVLRFARRAHRLEMAVLFNTARRKGHGNLREAKAVLRNAGYPVTRICGRLRGDSIVEGKQRCRRKFRERGYTLVANVGNRRTDFVGRGYERAYKLPGYGGRLR
jgi:HAD superfamily, subfamily IIIB (Acid phosphatase)